MNRASTKEAKSIQFQAAFLGRLFYWMTVEGIFFPVKVWQAKPRAP
jgi:hypothetical protein